MFAVYDGHGKKGHDCARFVKKKLPATVATEVRQARVNKYKAALKRDKIPLKGTKLFDPPNWPSLDSDEYKGCCRRAFIATNKDLHKSDVSGHLVTAVEDVRAGNLITPFSHVIFIVCFCFATQVEDNISGTTAITANFHGSILSICNVGDSRAVLGHQVDFKVDNSNRAISSEEAKEEIGEGKAQAVLSTRKQFPKPESLLAIPLSRDQTPYRKDERERVKLKGAAIMSIDQIEGKEEMHENWGDMVLGEDVDIHGDPPRVWVEGKDYPGTAFTRSIGDSLAESIGVTAQPEMLATTVTSNDHLLVVASDGVFEFLTNQEVIDICAQCESPIVACEKIVKEAYRQWLIYENRTDDITVIVCFLTVESKTPPDTSVGTTEDLVELARSMYGNKPVRKSRGFHDNLSTPSKEATPNGGGGEKEGSQKVLYDLGFSIFENKALQKTNPDPATE